MSRPAVVDKKTIISAYVDATLKNELQRLANDGDRPLSREVARALNQYVEHARTNNLEEARP